ncbi:uncharacterized protein ARMOST_07967 [Armillaria ostoyae]|uniref:SET domain-containing protein n=1 Tax=Armillaria ostoyae TaxID=47428 RepID=A0A284R7D8_ARMOS|nr:uncharacterized protein ARMOST_07967 [Armillaria ostoyae]
MFDLPTIIVENKIDAEAIPPAFHTYYEGMMTCQGVPDVMMLEVVQLRRQCHIKIAKTCNKGWGVFLTGSETVARGTFIGLYAGQYIMKEEGIHHMASTGSSYLFDLDFYHLQDVNPSYMIDGERMGNFARYMNHSCEANCCVEACYIDEGNLAKPLVAIFANEDINPNEELTLSYFGGILPSANSPSTGVRCECKKPLCVGYIFP